MEPHVLLRPAQQVSGESMNSKLSEVRLRWFVRIPSKCTGTFIIMSYQIEATFLVNINKYTCGGKSLNVIQKQSILSCKTIYPIFLIQCQKRIHAVGADA